MIKVFCHEKAIKEDFDELNDRLRENAFRLVLTPMPWAPINNNLGYVQYAILAVVGGLMAVYSGGSLLTLGKLISFLTLSRSFNMPISQISNQVNSVVMALAGAERIFQLMDEPSEEDHGYVELVNAKIDENGNITESAERNRPLGLETPPQGRGQPSPTPN